MLRLIKLRMQKRKCAVELDPIDLVGGVYEDGFDVAVTLDVRFLDQLAIDVGGVQDIFLSDLVIQLSHSYHSVTVLR